MIQIGRTALNMAVINGRYNCTQLLIQAGADVDIKDNVSLMIIMYINMIILMIYLTDDTQVGYTALHCAVWMCQCDSTKLLIVSAADTTIRNNV